MRIENDSIGNKEIPDNALYGIHTARACENFTLTGRKVDELFIESYAKVKKACANANHLSGFLSKEIFDAINLACDEMVSGKLSSNIIIDSITGGAGTSLNMNVNEVLANRAIEILGGKKGDYEIVHPINHVNHSQSTNDTYPTALKIASIYLIRELHASLERLQDSLQKKEAEFSKVVKMGRTQLQDAVPITLGMEFSAYAEAIARDRWRLYKTEERLRFVNIGGTAVGTGLTASKKYQFLVTEKLREITGIGLARPENLVDLTQNTDVFAEVSGLLKSCAVSMTKIANDIRLLSSGPKCGLMEITIPERQMGSSIMPYKINPVIPEAVNQLAFIVFGNDVTITHACSAGQLELNAFLPVIADRLLESIRVLRKASDILRTYCVEGITANIDICKENLNKSLGIATILVPIIGYDKASEIVKFAAENQITVKESILQLNYLSGEEVEKIFKNLHELLKPQT